jgi:catalase (peroxidase I)
MFCVNTRPAKSNPMGEDFNYAEEFKSLDYDSREKGSLTD